MFRDVKDNKKNNLNNWLKIVGNFLKIHVRLALAVHRVSSQSLRIL